ncbi:TPA: helix-turn-helix domain-containing protein [Streptococcus suis]
MERWLKEGHSNREIARRLAKSPQTINNKVKRGKVRQ